MVNKIQLRSKMKINSISLKPTVFIIDDDPEILNVLRHLLESVDLEVRCFENSSLFLEAYSPKQPGCIIADMRMPVMSGLQLFKKLKSMGSNLPVIILSAYGDIPMAV